MVVTMLIAPSSMKAGIWDEGNVENGQALFNANCASCHKVTNEVLAAPGLAGIAERWGSSEEILVQWIQNPQGAAETGDPYVKSLVDRYVGTYGWMTAQAVSADDIKDIMAYVQNPPDVVATADTGTDCPTIYDAIEEEHDTGRGRAESDVRLRCCRSWARHKSGNAGTGSTTEDGVDH